MNSDSCFRDYPLSSAADQIESPTPSMSTSSSGGLSEDFHDLSYMHSNLSKHMKLDSNASLADVKNAIDHCKSSINNSKECSDERKWFVRYLVELRLRVQQMEDIDGSEPLKCISTMGHHFKVCTTLTTTKKQHCDQCCGVIWGVLHGSYICKDCNYICHLKCVDKVLRVCVHVIAAERGELMMNICPQSGLGAQSYKCAECRTYLNSKIRWSEPRLCDYYGLFFCSNCHWNDTCEIPARIVHNWDWEKRPVSRSAYQLLTLTRKLPMINLETANEKLYSFVTELDFVRKVRGDIKMMRKYLVECQIGSSIVTPEILAMSETPQLFSIDDFEMVKETLLERKLSILAEKCREHITYCQVCKGKAYLCELCGNDEIIFPFDSSAVGCVKCNSYFHRFCWIKRHQTCPKCIRIEKRNLEKGYDEDAVDFDLE